jgi:hypothetical protein
MSKKPLSRDAVMALDPAGWRRRIQQLSIAHPGYWPPEFLESTEANADNLADALLDRPAQYGLASVKNTRTGYSMAAKDFSKAVLIAFRAGFLEAMQTHRQELLSIGDVIVERQSRISGGDKGRRSSSRKREQRYKEIREKWATMEATGENPTNQKLARAFGCSISTVIRAFKVKPRTQKRG